MHDNVGRKIQHSTVAARIHSLELNILKGGNQTMILIDEKYTTQNKNPTIKWAR